MATKDLIDQLKSVIGQLDPHLQQPIRDAILRLLDDKNSDVATMSVKCLSQMATKFTNDHITFIVDKLGDMIVDPSKTSSRDIVTDGLQTLIASIPDEAGTKIAPKLILGLMRGLTQKPNQDGEVDMEMACLSILKNVRTTSTSGTHALFFLHFVVVSWGTIVRIRVLIVGICACRVFLFSFSFFCFSLVTRSFR